MTAVNTQNVLEYWVKQKTLLSLQRFPAEVEHLPTNFSRARVKGELKLLMKKVLRQAQGFSISTWKLKNLLLMPLSMKHFQETTSNIW